MKTLKNRDLWRAIEAFDIDGGPAALTFVARLARENEWTREFAARVVMEYRRFVFLAMVGGHPVTPSDEVDQAWHLHMTYTRSYWDRLCAEVLGKPLHHDPTRGGPDEGAKFEDWYARTKKTYATMFGEEPPRDVWPDAQTRFGDAPHFARVNTRRYWMIRRPRSWRRPVLAAAAVGTMTTMVGCVATLGQTNWWYMLFVAGAVMAIPVLIGIAIRSTRRSGTKNDGSGCGFWWWGGGSGCGSSHDGGSGGCGSSGCGGGGCGGGD